MARILVVLSDGAEEIETMAVADILVRAGQEVVIAGTDSLNVTGSRQLPMRASILLDEALNDPWDAVYVPGGVGSADRATSDERIQNLMQQQLESGKLLGIMCAGPQALVPRKLCAGKKLTCYPSLRDHVEPHAEAWLDQPVVEDGNLITSQGPATAIAMGLAMAKRLAGNTTANEVAAGMLVTA